ncbi:hypothetical protein REPUB_Repub17cG0028000 [Reevesia pubescens]
MEQDLYAERFKEFLREVAIMKRLRHPNIVLLMEAVTQPPNLSIVTEYLSRGSLYRLFHKPGVRETLDERRRLSMAYNVVGSSFTMLARSFIEFCILGTDNLPRTSLMYFANTPYSFTNYFPTVLCNSDQFKSTVINHNLQYVAFNKSSTKKPPPMNSAEFDAMIQSGAAFGTRFQFDDPVLDCIDLEILKRSFGKVVPGGWCLGEPGNDTCSVWGNAHILRPSPGARRLEKRIVKLLSNDKFWSQQCLEE